MAGSALLLLLFPSFLYVAGGVTFFCDNHGIGIRNEHGEKCLRIQMASLLILNHNLGPEAVKEELSLSEASLGGFCSQPNRTRALLTASMFHQNTSRTVKLYFSQASMVVKQYEELRWQLYRIVYSESNGGNKVSFSSMNGTVIASGPVRQLFTCRDSVNGTLYKEGYEPVEIWLTAPLEMDPFGMTSSNLFICDRTRRRTLVESLETKATVASGILLLLSSFAVIVGHTLRRHFMPERKQFYDNLR